MPSPASEPVLFDPVAIEKLRSVAGDQDKGFVTEMAKLFLDETTKSLAEIRAGSLRGDWKVVSRYAHSLKSSAATLGFMRLSSACKALEVDTKGASSGPETEALTSAVFAEFDLTLPILKTLS